MSMSPDGWSPSSSPRPRLPAMADLGVGGPGLATWAHVTHGGVWVVFPAPGFSPSRALAIVGTRTVNQQLGTRGLSFHLCLSNKQRKKRLY